MLATQLDCLWKNSSTGQTVYKKGIFSSKMLISMPTRTTDSTQDGMDPIVLGFNPKTGELFAEIKCLG